MVGVGQDFDEQGSEDGGRRPSETTPAVNVAYPDLEIISYAVGNMTRA